MLHLLDKLEKRQMGTDGRTNGRTDICIYRAPMELKIDDGRHNLWARHFEMKGMDFPKMKFLMQYYIDPGDGEFLT